MLLGRRESEPLLVRMRVAIWPRRSWRRSLRYGALRLARLDATPHRIGLGLAVGVFAAFQPILGFQMLLACALAWLIGGSMIAALVGTCIGTPATWPIMWLASYHVGALIVGGDNMVSLAELASALMSFGALLDTGSAPATGSLVWKVLYPLAIGAIPLGAMAGAGFYVAARRAVGRRHA